MSKVLPGKALRSSRSAHGERRATTGSQERQRAKHAVPPLLFSLYQSIEGSPAPSDSPTHYYVSGTALPCDTPQSGTLKVRGLNPGRVCPRVALSLKKGSMDSSGLLCGGRRWLHTLPVTSWDDVCPLPGERRVLCEEYAMYKEGDT